jgi:thiol:disulfide interchange protein DsbD
MYAAAIWLVWVFVQQVGVNAIVIALGGMLLIAFAAWLYNTSLSAKAVARRAGTGSALLLLIITLVISYFSVNNSSVMNSNVASPAEKSAAQNWEAFSESRLTELLAEGKPVFLNFTAAWCINCLVNERVALSDVRVKDTFNQQGIMYLKGDWTNRDPAITQFLQKFNRSGVPLYVFYPAGQQAQPAVLPQILTPDTVISAVTPSSL